MAHLTAAGVPLAALVHRERARQEAAPRFWTASLAVCTAALVLSRTRAAWLALAVSAVLAGAIVLSGPALVDEPGDPAPPEARAASRSPPAWCSRSPCPTRSTGAATARISTR